MERKVYSLDWKRDFRINRNPALRKPHGTPERPQSLHSVEDIIVKYQCTGCFVHLVCPSPLHLSFLMFYFPESVWWRVWLGLRLEFWVLVLFVC